MTELIDRYLIDGVLPPSHSECEADPRPSVPADDAPESERESGQESMLARVQDALEDGSIWQAPTGT